MKIAAAQLNPTVGDIQGNSQKIIDAIHLAKPQGVDLVVFGELSLIGYPPKDLLLKPQFIEDQLSALKSIAEHCDSIAALVGYVSINENETGRHLHNSAALLNQGIVKSTYIKQLLPTYDVFDETRYFEPAASQSVIELNGQRLGLTICEDIWRTNNHHDRTLYDINPIKKLAEQNIDCVINMSASPFEMDKHDFRLKLFTQQCKKYQLPLIYVNQVGGNDELVFDGSSCCVNSQGQIIAQAKDFEEDFIVIDLESSTSDIHQIHNGIAAIHDALVLGLRDYVRKCGFKSVLLGLSGGIDSAVTAALAVTALGKDHVMGVAMPSRYSSQGSIDDAKGLAENLGISFDVIPIEAPHKAMEQCLRHQFTDTHEGIAEENIQARLRGNILMSLSNKFGSLLLTTGNKSELAVGYCTMYGDMAGGLAVISDVPKMLVYDLARYINRDNEIIPNNTITKPPSAELKPDQTDQDSLPPYEILDDILQLYVEKETPITEIVESGFEEETVRRIVSLVDRNEYKRKQAAPGLKVTSRAFGVGRRMPIAQRYRQT